MLVLVAVLSLYAKSTSNSDIIFVDFMKQPVVEHETAGDDTNNASPKSKEMGTENQAEKIVFTPTVDVYQSSANTPTGAAKKDDKVTASSASRLVERIRTAGDSKLLSLTPRLGGGPHDDMVSLDDDDGAEKTVEADSGASLLLQRLMKHIHVQRAPKAKAVQIR